MNAPITALLYVFGAIVSGSLVAGMAFHDLQAIWLTGNPKQFERHMAEKARQLRPFHLQKAVIFGTASAVIWPLALPMFWCVTGFGRHGIFRQAPREDGPA